MTWDKYFYDISVAVSANSKCYSRKVGAILVDDNKCIVATGYNGVPSGISHCEKMNRNMERACPRRLAGYQSGEGLHLCRALHAEENVIIWAARRGMKIEGTTLYLNRQGVPCLRCTEHIIQAGIKEVVVTSLSEYPNQTYSSLNMFAMARVKIRPYRF
jgi:dCMP deaminase